MKRTKCISVRLSSLVSISDKAYKATAYDGSSCILPKSQVFGQDYEVMKSDAYWISEWILQQKDIQYSSKKVAFFDENHNKLPNYEVEYHTAEKIAPKAENIIEELKR